MNSLKTGLGPFVGGVLFSIGLGISGMTEPLKVIGFLDIFGNWDPSLLFVMVGAIAVNAVLYKFIAKNPKPLFSPKFYLPTKTSLDKRLIIGSALFGIGWGVTGLCPGPGLASLSKGTPYIFTFVLTMLLGMGLVKAFDTLKTKRKEIT